MPILVSGELAAAKEAWHVLGGSEGRPVELLATDFTAPEGFDSAQFMVNLGLAQRDLPSNHGSLISLNAMPAQYLPRGVNWFNILAPAIGLILVGVLVYGWTYIQDIKTQNDAIQPQIDAAQIQFTQAQAKLTALQTQVKTANDAVAPVQNQVTSLLTYYSSLDTQRQMASVFVRNAWIKHPDTVALASVDFSGTTLVITGTAVTSETNVFTYAASLRDTMRFKNVVVSEVVKRLTEDTKVYVFDFTLTCS